MNTNTNFRSSDPAVGMDRSGAKLPRATPIYGLFALPMGRLFKVCAEPCMYSPGYIRSNKPRWPQ
jgi:hypothetical protein